MWLFFPLKNVYIARKCSIEPGPEEHIAGKKELSLLLENMSQEKRQLEAKDKELRMSPNLALNNFRLSAEKTQLSLILENTLQEK